MLIDGMSVKQCLEPVFVQIKRDAAEQHIDLNDSANLFSIWSDGFSDRMQYCGSRQALDAALKLADDHKHLKELYIIYAGSQALGILLYGRGTMLM